MNILQTVKGIANLAKQIGDIELQAKIIDLQSEVYDLIEENHQLRMKMGQLDDVKKIREKLKPVEHVYYLETDNELEGPFCSACWDKEQKLIRLHVVESTGRCPICEVITYYIGK
jgi:regulator of replication initiation timing